MVRQDAARPTSIFQNTSQGSSVLQGVFWSAVFSFLLICSSVKRAILCTHRHITVFMFLNVHTTFNQDLFSAKSCLMSFVKPSHALKLKSVLDSSATVCLDKVVYFTLEQTPTTWTVHYPWLGKELPQQKILMLKFISDSLGKKWALTKAYKFMLKAEKLFWTLPSGSSFLSLPFDALDVHSPRDTEKTWEEVLNPSRVF